MTNLKIRQAIANNRLRYYEVAAACGVSSSTFSVWMRTELTPERKRKVMNAIDEVLKAVGT